MSEKKKNARVDRPKARVESVTQPTLSEVFGQEKEIILLKIVLSDTTQVGYLHAITIQINTFLIRSSAQNKELEEVSECRGLYSREKVRLAL